MPHESKTVTDITSPLSRWTKFAVAGCGFGGKGGFAPPPPPRAAGQKTKITQQIQQSIWRHLEKPSSSPKSPKTQKIPKIVHTFLAAIFQFPNLSLDPTATISLPGRPGGPRRPLRRRGRRGGGLPAAGLAHRRDLARRGAGRGHGQVGRQHVAPWKETASTRLGGKWWTKKGWTKKGWTKNWTRWF